MPNAQINLRCDPNLVTRLDKLSEDLGYSRNQLIEIVLTTSVDALEQWSGPQSVIETAVLSEPSLQRPVLNALPLPPDIAPEDLKVEVIPGENQEVHKGLRGIRLTHLPTGLTVEAVRGDSQLANKAEALVQLQRMLAEPEKPRPVVHRHFHKYTEQISDTRYDKGVPMANHRCECGDVQYRRVEQK